MKKQDCLSLHAYEAVLTEAVKPIASELRGIDAADLIAFARLEREASLAELVDSAVEFYYRPGHFGISGTGSVRADWNGTPEIRLMLMFRNEDIEVYFILVLGTDEGALSIDYINYQCAHPSGVLSPERLKRSLEDCRLMADAWSVN